MFVNLQVDKCAYCERVFSSSGVEIDIDHYRPKRQVRIWETSSFNFEDEEDPDQVGYYLLAYNLGNYLAACATCNRTYKHDYFPVFEKRQTDTEDLNVMASERPLLINPIDPNDEDPETLIEFSGLIPRPRSPEESARLRALGTIELLGLAHRDELLRERADVVVNIWLAYRTRSAAGDLGQDARDFLTASCQLGARHANCARSFLRLAKSDEEAARDVHEAIEPLWLSYQAGNN